MGRRQRRKLWLVEAWRWEILRRCVTSPEWRSSVGQSLGRKICDCGSEGCKSGCLGTGELEAGERFAEVHVEMMHMVRTTTSTNQQRLFHYQKIYITILLVYLGPQQYRFPMLVASRHVVGSVTCKLSRLAQRASLAQSCHESVGSTIIHQSCCLISDVIP